MIRLTPHHPRRVRWATPWLLVVLVLSLMGCEETTTEPPPDTPPTNPDAPNSNALVTAHRITGSPDKATSYWDLADLEDDTFLVSGIQDGIPFAARLQSDGTPIWTLHTGYEVADAHSVRFPGGGWGVVLVGGFDANADGVDDRGIVTVHDAGSELLCQMQVGASGADIVLNDVEVLENGEERCKLIVIGFTSMDAASLPIRPLAMRIDLYTLVREPGLNLAVQQQKDYPELTGCSFRDVESDPLTAPEAFVSGNLYESDGSYRSAILGRLSDSLQAVWARSLAVAPEHRSAVKAGSLQVADGILYVVGESEVDKDPPPSGGGHWHSGMAAAISPDGQLLWSQLVSLTQHGESFAESRVDGPYLYASGWCARYQYGNDGECFGYGLLTKIDRANGTVLANMSFGDPHFASGFNALVVRGNRAVCVGWTSDYLASDGRFQAWFTDIAVGGPAAPHGQPAAPSMPAGAPETPATASRHGAGIDRPEKHASQP